MFNLFSTFYIFDHWKQTFISKSFMVLRIHKYTQFQSHESRVWRHMHDVTHVTYMTSHAWHMYNIIYVTCMTSHEWHHTYATHDMTYMTSHVWRHMYNITHNIMCITSHAWHHVYDTTCMTSHTWHHLHDVTAVSIRYPSLLGLRPGWSGPRAWTSLCRLWSLRLRTSSPRSLWRLSGSHHSQPLYNTNTPIFSSVHDSPNSMTNLMSMTALI